MRQGVLKIAALACASFLVLPFGAGCGKKQEKELQSGMFCWDEEIVDDPEVMEELVERLQITRWYQEFTEEPDVETTSAFIDYMRSKSVSVDALVGSVDWGFESDGSSLIACIKAIAAYNEGVEEHRRIHGIMVDVEPYITKRFKGNKEKYMKSYIQGMKKAYEFANEMDMRFIACIPRNYEEQGLATQLEELISQACDEVAVMNYGRGDEVEMIATEAALAEKYSKKLHCILEFQNIGKHGLTENETYREVGIGEAQIMWEDIRAAYPDVEITADYHWTRPLLEMLKEE